MMQLVIRMSKEEEKADRDQVSEVRKKAATFLMEYMETFHPEDRRSDSKHALMGPVGKLLSRITTTGEINWDAVKGYVLSIHKNQQGSRGVSAEAAERLDKATTSLSELKEMLPATKWLKTVEDIDDEVFFGLYKTKLVGQRKGIQKQFQEWLKTKYAIEDINKQLDSESQYKSVEDVEDPFSTPTELASIVKEFWEHRKSTKEGQQK